MDSRKIQDFIARHGESWKGAYSNEDYWEAKRLLDVAIEEGDGVDWFSDELLRYRFAIDLALTCVQLHDYETAERLLLENIYRDKPGSKVEGVKAIIFFNNMWIHLELAALYLRRGEFANCLSELKIVTTNTWDGCDDRWDPVCEMINKIFAHMIEHGALQEAASHFDEFFNTQKVHYTSYTSEEFEKSQCIVPFLELAIRMFSSLGNRASADNLQKLVDANKTAAPPKNFRFDHAVDRQRRTPAFVGQLMHNNVDYWLSPVG